MSVEGLEAHGQKADHSDPVKGLNAHDQRDDHSNPEGALKVVDMGGLSQSAELSMDMSGACSSFCASPPEPPPPLQVGQVNHFSAELIWEDALKEATTKGKGKGMVKVLVERKEVTVGRKSSWTTVYKGMAKRYKFSELEPESSYIFRYLFDQKGSHSDWSCECPISTTKEPLYAYNLHMAIKKESLEELELVLKSGDVSADVQNDDGFTGLMAAAKKPFLEAIDMLMEFGADIDYQNRAGKTALMVASAANMVDSVRELRKHKADWYISDNGGCTAVHWAVDARNVKLIDYMAADHVNFNIRDHGSGGWTPLIRCATLHGDRDVALSLMIGGADINGVDNVGSTALHHAVNRKHYDLVQLLLQRKADPTQENNKSTTPWQIATCGEDKRLIAQLMEPYVEEKKKEQSKIRKAEAIASTKKSVC